MTDAAIPLPAGGKMMRSVVTPEGVAVHIKLATLGERFSALMIDFLILVATMVALALLSLAVGGYLGWTAFVLLLFLLRAFYFSGFELAWNGRTPGKRMTSLRVINRRGGPLTPAAVIARNLMREVELFVPLSLALSAGSVGLSGGWTWLASMIWVGVLVCLPIFNRDRLRAGDMIGGTWVVVEPKPVLLPDLAEAEQNRQSVRETEAYRFTTEQLDVYGVKELQVLEDVLRSGSAASSEVRHDIAERIARKIGTSPPIPNDLETTRFLEAFYAAQRRRLEAELSFGRRRRDKFDKVSRTPTRSG
ncbi:MAG TPA: RDD family protein [Reyranella sp.]|nr:RDD family protein [Reyranella sp.]